MNIRPVARRADILTEELEGELVIYDKRRDVACRLNRTAALVWRNADGVRTVEDLIEVLRDQVSPLADEDLVMVTLDRLEEQELLEPGYPHRTEQATALSRRRFITRAGALGTAALALPVVQAIVAPTPAPADTPSR